MINLGKNDLALILIIVFFMAARGFVHKRVEGLKTEIYSLRKVIAKEKAFRKNQKEVLEKAKKAEEIHSINTKGLFRPGFSTTALMAYVQDMIKKGTKTYGVEMMSLTWGEPFDEAGYQRIPISLTVKGGPKSVISFIRSLFGEEGKVWRIVQLYLAPRGEKYLEARLTLTVYKLK